jgi:NAD(P)-dependent dehydrogenase (short-subunit alcohol dehydrogenase family)
MKIEGAAASASLADGGVEVARAEMETNYFGSMRVARAFAPILRDNGGGALVNVLSVLSLISTEMVEQS